MHLFIKVGQVLAGCLAISVVVTKIVKADATPQPPLFNSKLNEFSTLLTSSVEDFAPPDNSFLWHNWLYGYYRNGAFVPFPSEYNTHGSWQTPWGELTPDGGYFNAATGGSYPLVRRWVSNFNGTVNLEGGFSLPNLNGTAADLDLAVYVDGQKQAVQFALNEGASEGRYQINLRVKEDTIIDFTAQANDGWSGSFEFKTDIYVPPGLIFINAPDWTLNTETRGVGIQTYIYDHPAGNNEAFKKEDRIIQLTEMMESINPLGDPISSTYQIIESEPENNFNFYGWRKDYENGYIFQHEYYAYSVTEDGEVYYLMYPAFQEEEFYSITGKIAEFYLENKDLTHSFPANVPPGLGSRRGIGLPIESQKVIGDDVIVQRFHRGWIVASLSDKFPTFMEYGSRSIPSEVPILVDNERRPFENNIYRVGLVFDNQVFEAFRNYGGRYFDPVSDNYIFFSGSVYSNSVLGQQKFGVQTGHTLPSFIHRSSGQVVSFVDTHWHVPINLYKNPFELDPEQESLNLFDPNQYVQIMADKITERLGDELITNFGGDFMSCNSLKGEAGGFTNVSLMEWASEGIDDINGGEGFLEDHVECLNINGDTAPSFLNINSTDQLQVLTEDSSYAFFLADAGLYGYLLDTELFQKYISGEVDLLSNLWLKGLLRVDEFTLTDPLGRKLGYTKEGGVFSEISNTFLSRREYEYSPKFSYQDGERVLPLHVCEEDVEDYLSSRGVRNYFSLFIPDRIEGDYSLEISGFNPDLKIALETEEGGILMEADECATEHDDSDENDSDDSEDSGGGSGDGGDSDNSGNLGEDGSSGGSDDSGGSGDDDSNSGGSDSSGDGGNSGGLGDGDSGDPRVPTPIPEPSGILGFLALGAAAAFLKKNKFAQK